MFGIRTEALLGLVAVILCGFAGWDYLKSARTWTQRSKTWLQIALIFVAVAVIIAVS